MQRSRLNRNIRSSNRRVGGRKRTHLQNNSGPETLPALYRRGICPNGRPVGSISWATFQQAERMSISLGQGNTGGGQSVYQDYNGDGKIDIADLVYFIQ
jgi:hypothetical protein